MAEEKRRSNKRRHIPAELVEKILLNLPVKSLCRFSTVSKSWNATIFKREFAKVYRGREMIVLRAYYPEEKALVLPLSSLSSDNPIARAKPFVRPFTADNYVAASCGELWCVEFEDSLLLYNPSLSKYRKLPTPPSSARVPIGSTVDGFLTSVYAYGLGVAVDDGDFKIIKIHRTNYVETELYSLRSDSWRKVESPPQDPYKVTFVSSGGLYVSGALHWQVTRCRCYFILSFDLSTEKFAMLKLPKRSKAIVRSERHNLGLSVFGGKLRVWRNYGTSFTVWVMDDYESKSWTKELEIDYGHIYPLCFGYVKPFYFTDSDGNLIKAVYGSTDMQKIFLCREGDGSVSTTLVEKNFCCSMFHTYIENFVSL